jgi:hypothetical protein
MEGARLSAEEPGLVKNRQAPETSKRGRTSHLRCTSERELSLLEASEVDVLTAEPSQFGSVGEALLNLHGLPFWG